MSDRKSEYEAYLLSDRWAELRSQRMASDRNECVLCGNAATEVHHRRYPDVLGTETVHDLVCLCRRCHSNYHFPPGLDEARRQLRDELKKGTRCPCCDQNAKLYKRKLNKAMALCLKELFAHAGTEYRHIHDMTAASRVFTEHMHGGNFATMSYWGLIATADSQAHSEGRTSGVWRVTDLGVRFLRDEVRVPRYVFTFNMRCEATSEETISIQEALGEPFRYRELAAPSQGDARAD